MTSLFFYILLFCIQFLSILGYGMIYEKIVNINKRNILNNDIAITYILGLVATSIIAIFIGFFIPINNLVSIIFLLIGSIIFFLFYKNSSITLDINFIVKVIIIAFLTIFFIIATEYNNDFNPYHLQYLQAMKEGGSITNFEAYNRRTIFNPNILAINSILWIKEINVTMFFLNGALLFSIITTFLEKLITKIRTKEISIIGLYYLFTLLFLIAGFRNYKDFGTDYQAHLIIIFLIGIYLEFIENNTQIKENKIHFFLIFLQLIIFAIILKITSALLILFLFYFILKNNFLKKDNLKYLINISIVSLPLFLWIIQNIFISKCLVYPIPFLCFSEKVSAASEEMYFIEVYAKGMGDTWNYKREEILENLKEFRWIKIWYENHFYKIRTFFGVFFVLTLLPPLFIYSKKKNRIKINNNFKKNISQLVNIDYLSILIVFLLSTIFWFFFSPSLRFGLSYLIIISICIMTPFWQVTLKDNKNYFFGCSVFILISAFSIFLYSNLEKILVFLEQKNNFWPEL